MTDIKEPINTTSDGTFLSVVCENPEKSDVGQNWGATAPPPRNYPPVSVGMCVGMSVCLRLSMGNPYNKIICQNAWEELCGPKRACSKSFLGV